MSGLAKIISTIIVLLLLIGLAFGIFSFVDSSKKLMSVLTVIKLNKMIRRKMTRKIKIKIKTKIKIRIMTKTNLKILK